MYDIPYLENIPASVQFVAVGVVLLVLSRVYSVLTSDRPYPGFPIVSLTEKGLNPQDSFNQHSTETVLKGMNSISGCFQVITTTGPKIVVPNRFADELKNNENLDLNGSFAKDFFPNYPGFESFKEGLNATSMTAETVRIKLTQSLGLITNDLVDETTFAIHDILGEDTEWHTTMIKNNLLDIVARLSSRVFLGKELCRNKRWLEISKNYTMDTFIAAHLMRRLPVLMRPIMHWFMPYNIKLRKSYKDASELILPEIEIRKERTRKAIEAGGKSPKLADTIGWMYEMARGRDVDFTAAQLSLTVAAIHTTSESIIRALLHICENPEILQPLRDEIIEVIGQEGWSKTALYKLRYMDSFLKESMRVGAMAVTSMNRLVMAPVQLPDGTILPKGARIMVAGRFQDPTIYSEPGKFQADRFLKIREQPGQQNSWQHVTTSAEHFGFGHGSHACPGRFFASNEIKIALAHLLLKYDWQLTESGVPAINDMEGALTVQADAQLRLRRRQEEICIDLPESIIE